MTEQDKTGQSRLGRNLLSLWAVEIVVIVSGFVTPRLIDEQLGQVQLGVWDLGWSIVSYFRFLGMGMTGGLNRYVALYQASGEVDKLSRIVSSTIALQVFWAVLMMIFSLGAAVLVPRIVAPEYVDVVEPVRWVVVFLGATLAMRTLGSPARGLLTGYHLWTWNSRVQIAGDIASLVAMVVVLLMGGGLRELAGSYFLVTVITESVRFWSARTCYGAKMFNLPHVALAEMKELFVFSLKTNAGVLPHVIVIQTLNIALASAAGPAALAVYARSLALQRHASEVISSFTKLLTPTVGSLQGLGRESEYKPFFLRSMRMSLALSLPLYIVLSTQGDLLLDIWMGKDYIARGLMPLICAGMLLPAVSMAALRILAGLNTHGRAGVISFFITALLLVAGLIAISLLKIIWSVQVAAILLGASLSFGSAVPIIVIACRQLGVKFSEFSKDALLRPVAANLPFALLLIGGSNFIDPFSIIEAAILVALAGVLLLLSVWFLLLTPGEKQRVIATWP